MSDDAVELATRITVNLHWVKILVVISIVAIVTDVFALAMFVAFRRSASTRLEEQREALRRMGDAIDIMKRHAELARDQKEDTRSTLESIKQEAAKTATATAVAVEKAEQKAAEAISSATEKVAGAVASAAEKIGSAADRLSPEVVQ